VKAENIGKGLTKLDDDPRPKIFRNRPSFKDDVKNKTINFVHQSGFDISMRYAFSKANLCAAVQDHDYLSRPFTEF